jgi:hypothetical protein
MVASIFIVLMLAFGALMAFNEPVRATVINWTINIYNKLVDITFNHSENGHAYIICTPGELPDGFELVENYHSGYYTRNVYKNAEGQYIRFEYRRPTERQKERIVKDSESAEVIIMNHGIEMYCIKNGSTCKMFRYDAERDLAFYIESDLSKETLSKVFYDINYRLPLYEPSWLPDGYEESERYELYLEYDIDYYNADSGDYVYYSCSDMSATDLVFIDHLGDDIVVEKISINGNQSYFFPKTDSVLDNDLVIIDESKKTVHIITSTLDRSVILHIAESIVCKEP